jgi:beta-carotene 3-hydroxylase
MSLLNASIITLLTFLLMEGVAWFTHKFIMHGFLWHLHEDHHVKSPGFFEKNDSFFLIFAVPSALGFILGSATSYTFLAYIALGILLYGIAYFFIHEIFIHQRFKWFTRSDNTYLRGIRKAHKVHHKHLGKEEGECFGMLLVPFKYWEEQRKGK